MLRGGTSLKMTKMWFCDMNRSFNSIRDDYLSLLRLKLVILKRCPEDINVQDLFVNAILKNINELNIN